MSLWYCRLDTGEKGPMSFGALAGLMAAGHLRDDDLVRRSSSSTWEPAGDVIGLRRQAAVIADGAPETELSRQEEDEPAGTAAAAARRLVDSLGADAGQGAAEGSGAAGRMSGAGTAGRLAPVAGRWGALILVLAAGVVAVSLWWDSRPERFPAPGRRALARPAPPLLARVRLPPPEEPSVPGLTPLVPQAVPGCEEQEPIYSPTLSADLKILVFARMNGRHLYDLFMTSRSDPAEPFGEPQIILSTVTRETEAYCSLSPDGLELFYVSSDASPVILYCSRESVDAEFGEPVPWNPPDWPIREWRVGYPQFRTGHELLFAGMPLGEQSRSIFRATRSQRGEMFADVQPVEFSTGWPPYFVSSDGKRAWFGSPEGLQLAVRESLEERFRIPVVLVPSEKCGPIEGPLWMAPAEDVVFFCSPGPGKPPGSARRMWMMRLGSF